MTEGVEESKMFAYKEILGENPDAIFVLSGGIVKTRSVNRTPKYKSTAYSESDPSGLMGGGKARVIAAVEVLKYFPTLKVVTTSYVEKDTPTHAQIMSDELISMGVNPSRIVLEENSNSTISELIEMVQLSDENKWKNVVVISNRYHIPRLEEMYKRIEILHPDNVFISRLRKLEQSGFNIKFAAAEDILPLRSVRYKKLIDEMQNSLEYKKRVEAEENGLQAVKTGDYRKRN